MLKRSFIAASITAGVGFCIAVAFQVVAGVQYRIAEDQGLDPGYSPTWIVVGTNVGLLLFALAVLTAMVVGIAALIRHQRLKQR